MGPRAGLDNYGRSRPTGIRSQDRPARRQSLYRLSYPTYIVKILREIKCVFGRNSFLGFAAGGTYNKHWALKIGLYTVFQRTVSIHSVISIYLGRRFRHTQTGNICPHSLHTNCELSYNPQARSLLLLCHRNARRCKPTSTPVYYRAVQVSCPLVYPSKPNVNFSKQISKLKERKKERKNISN